MKRVCKYLLFSILITFIFINKINAECSFDERKELLEKTKDVVGYFEPDVSNNKFVFYLYNLDNDLFVRLENLNDNQTIEVYRYQFQGDFYSMDVNNTSDVINYKLYIYSNKSECYSHYLTSKNIKKGIINKFYSDDICNGIEDYRYCVPVLNNKFNISDEEVIKRINQYKDSLLVNEDIDIDEKFGLDDLLNIIKVYWYIPSIIISIVFIIFVIRFIDKKRGEL